MPFKRISVCEGILFFTMTDFLKCPRLYVDSDLTIGQTHRFNDDQSHYIRNVMRQESGDKLRVFNGRDGEFIVTLAEVSKKSVSASIDQLFKAQSTSSLNGVQNQHFQSLHLYLAPIKKARLEIMLEKAVELGVTDIHFVMTQNTENRNSNMDKIKAQIIEACEQCERDTIPQLHPPVSFAQFLTQKTNDPIYACLERAPEIPHLSTVPPSDHKAVLIGPEGGFTQSEIAALKENPSIREVSLGNTILRAETAAIVALALLSAGENQHK
jgi:16S rRNA (uracil1498-N3)-methyltransferase